jgi:KDO2-lipid IV(A) lauroyltransferase
MKSKETVLQKGLYYLFLPFIYSISLLPFPILYTFSRFLKFVVFDCIGYRKKIIEQNIGRSFPDKSSAEVKKIANQFYTYFCDMTLETLKTLTISKSEMLKRCTITERGIELLNKASINNESLILVLGHKGNWEWAGNTFSLLCRHQLFVIYHPLSNPYFDRLMYKMRTRFGTKLIPMKDTFKTMLENRNDLTATAFIADQTPSPEHAHWMQFLNQDTPVFLGTEKIATKMKRKIVYVRIELLKKGYYRLHLDEDNVLSFEHFSTINPTEWHTRKLESDIICNQSYTWLWSHKRWKHKRQKIE